MINGGTGLETSWLAKSVNDQKIAQSFSKDDINDGDFDNQVKVSWEYRLELL